MDPAARLLEADRAFDERENGVVAPEADVLTGMPLGPPLTKDDVARDDVLATELLDAEPLTGAVASVLN